jgi:outer membrane protein TolC
MHLPDRVPLSVPSDLLHQRPDILAAEAAVHATADEAGAATAACRHRRAVRIDG